MEISHLWGSSGAWRSEVFPPPRYKPDIELDAKSRRGAPYDWKVVAFGKDEPESGTRTRIVGVAIGGGWDEVGVDADGENDDHLSPQRVCSDSRRRCHFAQIEPRERWRNW